MKHYSYSHKYDLEAIRVKFKGLSGTIIDRRNRWDEQLDSRITLSDYTLSCTGVLTGKESMPPAAAFVKLGEELYELPKHGDSHGDHPLCNLCLNQLTCLSGGHAHMSIRGIHELDQQDQT